MYFDQVGFIPRKQDWYNLWKAINAIYHMKKLKEIKHNYFNRCRKIIQKQSIYTHDLNA